MRPKGFNWWGLFSVIVVSCAEEAETPAWSPDDFEARWYSENDSLAPRAEWGDSGLDPLAAVVDADGNTPYELILEFHSGSPTQTGADPSTWGFPLHFGIAGPFVENGKDLPMYECSRRGAVYDRGEFLVFCQPGKAILYMVFLAAEPVPISEIPDPPFIKEWWESSIAYSNGTHAERSQSLTVLPKFSFYGISERGYEVPVTFQPRAEAFPAPFEDRESERWRVAKFDDR